MQPIEEAREFVRSHVLRPIWTHPALDDSIKNKARASDHRLEYFRRVGDLFDYLKRYEGKTGAPTYTALKAHGLTTLEEIVDEFAQRFATWTAERTTLADFVVGEPYTTWDVLVVVGRYDARAGGMFVMGPSDAPDAVVIKATLEGGEYPNAWISPHETLRYYLKARRGVFGEHFVENAAILRHPQVPIYTFVRPDSRVDFTFEGIFHYHRLTTEPDQSKWFELRAADAPDAASAITQARLDENLEKALIKARGSSHEERQNRLANAPRQPRRVFVQSTGFLRNADVIAEVLERAAGTCEDCGQPAPFARRSDGSPYLEVHHRLPLAEDGEDTVENALALCPNCHRRAHFG